MRAAGEVARNAVLVRELRRERGAAALEHGPLDEFRTARERISKADAPRLVVAQSASDEAAVVVRIVHGLEGRVLQRNRAVNCARGQEALRCKLDGHVAEFGHREAVASRPRRTGVQRVVDEWRDAA